MVRGFNRPGPRGADTPAVIGEDVVDLLFPKRKRRPDSLGGELRDVLAAEGLHLRRVRARVEIAGEEVGVTAGLGLPGEAAQLFGADLRIEAAPGCQVRGVEGDRGAFDADRGF